jgi:signal transduction histidine kinase
LEISIETEMASPQKSRGNNSRPLKRTRTPSALVPQTGKARSRDDLRPLAAELLLEEQNERRILALELHDDVGQGLALLELSVETLEKGAPPQNQWKEQLQAVRHQIRSLSQSLRRIAYQLHPATLEHLGLAAALESYVREFTEREGIPVRFQATHMPDKIDSRVALCLYRIVEEGLRNIAQHSGSNSAEVKLRRTGSTIQLRVKDSGAGFKVLATKDKNGSGLRNIEQRALACGGVFKLKIRPGGGTEVLVEVRDSATGKM